MPGNERPFGGLADVRRCIEIGFADLQMDHRSAFGLEGAGTSADGERAFCTDGAHPVGNAAD